MREVSPYSVYTRTITVHNTQLNRGASRSLHSELDNRRSRVEETRGDGKIVNNSSKPTDGHFEINVGKRPASCLTDPLPL